MQQCIQEQQRRTLEIKDMRVLASALQETNATCHRNKCSATPTAVTFVAIDGFVHLGLSMGLDVASSQGRAYPLYSYTARCDWVQLRE